MPAGLREGPADALRILILEDVPRDADLAQRELQRQGLVFEARVTDTREGFLRALDTFRPDLILSDYQMPQFTGREALELKKQHAPDVPFVVLTASINEETAAECIKLGADDYVINDHLAHLASAVEGALNKKRLEKAEREARQSVERSAREWHFTFDAMRDGVALLDADARVRRCNNAFCELLGKPAEELVHQHFCGLLDVDLPECPARRAAQTLQRETWETQVGERWLDVSADPVIDDTGAHTGAVVVLAEVTDRRRAAAAAEEAAARLRLAVRATNIGPWEWDLETNEVYFSPEWKRQLGYEDAEIRGTYSEWEDRLHPDDRAPTMGALTAYLEGRAPEYAVEFRMRHRDGSYRWFYTRGELVRDSEGRPVRMLGCHVDITERRRTTDALQVAEQKMRALTGNIPGMVYSCRTDRTMEFVSKCEELSGYTAEDLSNGAVSWLEVIHPDDRGGWLDDEQALRRKPGALTRRYRIVRRTGEIRWVRDHRSAVLDADRSVIGVDGVIFDITHEIALEDQFHQTQKLEAIGTLAGGVAHDFNNLLSVINGYGEILLGALDKDDPIRDHLTEIAEAGARAATLTRQLLIFSRKQALEPEVVDLNALVANVERLLGRLIGEDVLLVTRLADGLGKVKADPGQVEQVIMNLAVNGRDAMPGGGRLVLETRDVDEEEVRGLQPDATAGRHTCLTVSDSGCGMDRQTLERIFDPFFTTKEQGTGLGLATVYGIVKQSGGFVHVRSEPGKGAAFMVFLPVVGDEAASATVPRDDPAALFGSETILVVEDEPAVRRLLDHMLASAGYRTLLAANGTEALELLAAHTEPVALVLTDMVMPSMSGPEFIAQLQRTRPGVPVLYMSGYSDHPIFRDGGSGSGVSFIPKPCRKTELLCKVREMLPRPRPPA